MSEQNGEATPRRPRTSKKGVARKPKIEVTQEIIDEATPRNSGHCVWADAIKASNPNAMRVSVDLATIRITDPAAGERRIYLTPRAIQESLVQFDQGIAPKPTRYQLPAPAQVVPVRKRDRNPGSSARSTRPRQGTGRNSHLTHEIVGGKTPPTGALTNAGNVRSFGVRNLRV